LKYSASTQTSCSLYNLTTFSCHTEGKLYHYLDAGNYLKKKQTFSDFKEFAVVLNLKTYFTLNELYEEFCVTKATLALFLNDRYEQNLPVRDKLRHHFSRQTLRFQVLHVCTIYSCVGVSFSITNCYCRNKRKLAA
jgi:hypothetical protein